jgi:hypothetical protein
MMGWYSGLSPKAARANGVAPTFETDTFYEISFKLVGTYLLGVCGAFKAV